MKFAPKELALVFFIMSTFYFENGHQASLRQFQFQCYSRDICTWPLEYCSSEKYERRCIPCSRSVCSRRGIPLQCQYNCSLIGEPTFVLPLVTAASIFAIVSIPVVYLIVKNVKLKKSMKKNKQKSEEMRTLIDSLQQDRKDDPSDENKCYGKNKLTDVNPTETDSSGSYKPTTYRSETSKI